MSAKKKGLGFNRGLDIMLSNASQAEQHAGETQDKGPQQLPIDAIVPNAHQPRRSFDEEGLQQLADSIKAHGLIQPVVVQKKDDGTYELIAGERRLRAAKLCGLTQIDAIVRTLGDDEAAELALIENIQRQDLNAIEEGAAYASLMDAFALTQDDVAQKVGKSRSHVANMMRLLKLPDGIQTLVAEGTLSMGQARPLLHLPTTDLMLEGAQQIIDKGLSARQAEQLVKAMLDRKPDQTPPQRPVPDAYLESMADKMKMHLGTAVSIKLGKQKDKGKIEISFTSEDELERLLAVLTDEGQDAGTDPISSFHV